MLEHIRLPTDRFVDPCEVQAILGSAKWEPSPLGNALGARVFRATDTNRFLVVLDDGVGGILFRDYFGMVAALTDDPRVVHNARVHLVPGPDINESVLNLVRELETAGIVQDAMRLTAADLARLDNLVIAQATDEGREAMYSRYARHVAALLGEFIRQHRGGIWITRPCAYESKIIEAWLAIGDSERVATCELADIVLRGVDEDHPAEACIDRVLWEIQRDVKDQGGH